MKILQVTSPQTFQVLDVPTPQPQAGEVLMKVQAVTTCPQWDLHLRHNEPMFIGHQFQYPYAPGQPGHEATGEITALGEGVTSFAVGDRVSTWRDPGHQSPGCYAQYVVRSVADVICVPQHLKPEATAPLELAMCVGATFVMLRPMDVLRGKCIGVMGLGPAGLIAAQMVRAEGAARIIGFDLSRQRCEMALSQGLVDEAHDTRTDLSTLFPARPARTALDSGIDCVGAKASVEFMMDHVHDVVALFGVQREDYTFSVRHYSPGVRLCGYPGHSRAAAEYAVSLIEAGRLHLEPLVTHSFPLEKYGEAIDLLEQQQAIKVCFWPWEESDAR
jgi:threonine dehydrogenase-like Zn-dependent dehydrogenase